MDTQSETITLELWVFWFDDRHTGLIDANLLLRELDELRVGSFTWENVSSKNTHRSNACTLVTVVMEYKLFIKAIRNLILPYMLKKDALPLGEFFVFPPSYLEPAVGEDCDTNPSSLLCCTYNIYLASTNLVFQPNTRRIRLRPLTSSDLNSKAKVLLSPTGEQALLDPSRRHTITHSYEDRLLKQWAALLQLPISQLISNNMPSLVLICMSYGEKVYYPSRLVFMITPTRQSPSALAGMNGTMGYNHGLTEDIAQKWNREMWLEQVLANQADKSRYRVDYWTYTNPRLHTTLAALDSLSTSTLNTPNSTDANSPLMIQGGVLIKALSEPVLSSPLMASKSVATPSSPLPRDDGDDDNEKVFGSTHGDTPTGASQFLVSGWRGNQTLTDFVQQHFISGSTDDLPMQLNGTMDMGLLAGTTTTQDTTASMMMTPQQHHQQDTLIMPPTNNMMQAHSQQQSSYTHSTPTHMMSNANYTSPLQMSYTASPQQPVPGQQPMYDQQQQLQLQQQQQQQLQQQQLQQQHQQPQQHIKSGQNLAINDGMNGGSTMDMNSIDVLDTMVYDMSTPWGGDGGLDNLELDLDVTEEDFNFFESEPAKPTTTTTTNMPTETAMADIQSLDFFQVNPEDSLQTNAVLDSLDFPQTDPVSTTDTTTGLDELMTSANYDGMILDTPKQEINQSVDMVVDSSPMPMDGTNTIVKQEPQDEGKISSTISSEFPADASNQDSTTSNKWPTTTTTTASTAPIHGGGREQRLVPPSFAPLSLSTIVNDAKYMEGGKFTYVPEDDDMTTTLSFGNSKKPTGSTKGHRRKQKDRTYRPDYVPIIKKKRNKKKVDDEQDITRSTVTGKNQTMEKSSTPTHLLDKDGDHDMMNTTLSNNIDTISDSNSISSSSDSSDSGNSVDDSESSSDSDNSLIQRLRDNGIQNGNIKPMATSMKRTLSSSTSTTTPGQDSKKDTEDNDSRQSLISINTAPVDDGISTSDNGSRAMEMDYADDDVDDDDDGLWLEKLGKARTIYLHRLVGDVKVVHGGKRRYLLDRLHLDYDTPFATTVTPGLVRPDRYHEEDDRPLHYLCQQAVLGGYPFTGGLAEISTNGGEVALGESTRIMIARRRDLVQHARGGATHVPCLPCDFDRVTQDFKSILGDIFDPKITVTDEPLPLSVTDFTSSVSVNGPLNVQQYYELSESNQIHSKYGKYQVKKRRPAEPNFDTLHSPDIVVSRHDEFIEGSPKMIDFWEKLRLEPYSAKKNISYFAVCPNNDELESAVQVFFKGLSTVYEACCLGAHHPGHIGPYRRGTVPVTLLPEEQGQSKRERQLKSYMATCEQLGTSLGGVMAENVYIVIYMVNPYPHLSSHLDLSKCYDRLMNAFEQARLQHTNTSIISGTTATSRLPSEKTRARLVMQLVPIEHIVRCTDFGSYTKNGLKEIAFSVYSKCPTIVNNHVKINVEEEITTPNTAEIYAPPFVLTKQIPENITYSLTPSLNAPVLLDQDATLHLAYGYSLDRRWMVVVWTDHRGELVEFAVLRASARQSAPFVTVFEEAWKRTLEIAGQTDFMWTFVIVKMGLMFENELQAWIHVLPENEKTAVISMDMESSLHVDALVGQEEPIPYFAPDTPQTPQTPNVGPNHVSTPPPTPQQASSSSPGNKNNISSMDMVDTTTNTTMTKILLLNHRVAYSRKRQRVSEGVTLMDAISDPESWILPLASGYLVQLPKQGSPTAASEEQFGRAPCVVELHLIYNQTQHSSYTTLRDIIKQYYALSYVNIIPSSYNCLPLHVVLADRLWRLLLVVDY